MSDDSKKLPRTGSPILPTRRQALWYLGGTLASLPLLDLIGCSGGSGTTGTVDASATADLASVPWATGGTASMAGKASYPNPFAGGAPTTCTLTCQMTKGPCWDSKAEVLQDISYGYSGLPMRMVLQVVNESCKPVPNAIVDVWHVSAAGKYSGDDEVNENVAFCTGSDPAFTSKLYFRGKQTTDANGLVTFDSCFPGWYASRTVHVHLAVTVGGESSVVSQLFFDDALSDDILGTQPLYNTRGKRDTTNQNDSVIAASAVSAYLFQTSKLPDGALLAWKTLVLRDFTSKPLCDAPSGSPGGMGDGGGGPFGPPDGGMGGPPPDGGPFGPPPDGFPFGPPDGGPRP